MKSFGVNRIGASIMVIIIIFVIIKRYGFDESKLNSNYKFTQAIVYRISYPAEGGPDADFEYCVNQLVYRGFISFNPTQQKIMVGKKFLLKYYPPNPKIARILLDSPLNSNSITKLKVETCK
jgi:hypothetical protein